MSTRSPKRQPAYPRAMAAFEAMKKEPRRLWSMADLAERVPLAMKRANERLGGVGTTIYVSFGRDLPFTEEVTLVQSGRRHLARLTHPEKWEDPKQDTRVSLDTILSPLPAEAPAPPPPAAAPPVRAGAGLPPKLAAKIEEAIQTREVEQMSFVLGQILGWHHAQEL